MEKDKFLITEETQNIFNTSNKTFYFAKVNVHENIFSEDLDNIIKNEIPRVIESATDIKLNSSTISFTDIIKTQIEDKTIIMGHVTNSKKEKMRFKEGPTTYFTMSEKEIANSALFIYDIESEILAFTTASKISIADFITYFTKLLSQDPMVGTVIIKTLPERYDLIKEFKVLDKITSVKFSLIQPNPRTRHYNLYNKIIGETKAKTLDVTIKEDSDGIDIGVTKKVSNQKITQEEDSPKQLTLPLEESTSLQMQDESSNQEFSNDEEQFNQPISDGIELVNNGYGEIVIKGETYSYISQGGKRKKEKKISHKKTFKSKESIKKLAVKGLDTFRAINKVVQYIKDLKF